MQTSEVKSPENVGGTSVILNQRQVANRTVWRRPLLQIPIIFYVLFFCPHQPWVVYAALESITHVETCTGRQELELVH